VLLPDATELFVGKRQPDITVESYVGIGDAQPQVWLSLATETSALSEEETSALIEALKDHAKAAFGGNS